MSSDSSQVRSGDRTCNQGSDRADWCLSGAILAALMTRRALLMSLFLSSAFVGCDRHSGASGRLDAGGDGAPAARRLSPDVEPFLRTYFGSWSQGDMNGYRAHFDDDAVVMFMSEGRLRAVLPLEPFIEQQASMQQDPERRGNERMLSFRADEDEQAITVTADWELRRAEGGRERGVDRFTLIRNPEGQLRIATILFYAMPD